MREWMSYWINKCKNNWERMNEWMRMLNIGSVNVK